jgi:hypothetical protein
MMRVEPSAQAGRPAAVGDAFTGRDNEQYSVRARTARTVVVRDYSIMSLDEIFPPTETTLVADDAFASTSTRHPK